MIARTVTVRPVDAAAWSCPTDMPVQEWRVMFELDTQTGVLSARACDGTGPRLRAHGLWDDARDVWVRESRGFERTPRVLGFVADVILDADQVNAWLERMAPVAGLLLQHLEEVPGAGWDWTVEAAAAHNRLRDLKLEGPTTDEHRRGLVDFIEHVDVIQDADRLREWAAAGMTDPVLEEAARLLTFSALPPSAGVLRLVQTRGWADSVPASWSNSTPVYVVGARAGLRKLRERQARELHGLEPIQASELWGERPPMVFLVGSDADDARLERLAGLAVSTVAEQRGQHLIGALEYLTAYRNHLRELKLAELSGAGNEAAYLREQLDEVTRRRAGLLEEILRWRLPAHYTPDGQIRKEVVAEVAKMTRPGLEKLLGRIDLDPPE